jgi:hypothetical protein
VEKSEILFALAMIAAIISIPLGIAVWANYAIWGGL